MKFLQLFGRLKSVVIGMVHVKALPGTPGNTLPVAQITEEACREAEIYRAAGVVRNCTLTCTLILICLLLLIFYVVKLYGKSALHLYKT